MEITQPACLTVTHAGKGGYSHDSWLATSDVLVGGDYKSPLCIEMRGATLGHLNDQLDFYGRPEMPCAAQMGTYVKQGGQLHNGKSIFKFGKYFLFYYKEDKGRDLEFWAIGSSLENYPRGFYNLSSASSPELILSSDVWKFYSTEGIVNDPGVKATLSCGAPLPCPIASHAQNNPTSFYFQVRIENAYCAKTREEAMEKLLPLEKDSLNIFMIGAFREDLNHNLKRNNGQWGSYAIHYEKSNAWLLNIQDGGLYSGSVQKRAPKCKQANCTCHGWDRKEQGERTVKVGDEMGVLIDVPEQGERRVGHARKEDRPNERDTLYFLPYDFCVAV